MLPPGVRSIAAAVLFALLVSACAEDSNTNWFVQIQLDDGIYQACALTKKSPFVRYQAGEAEYSVSVSTYALPLDLAQVINLEQDIRDNQGLEWSATAEDRLRLSGLVAVSGREPFHRFDDAYTYLKDTKTPTLVTTDSALHLYRLFFDQVLKNVEVRELIPMLRFLLPELFRSTASIYRATEGDLKEAARRNLALVGVAARLLLQDEFEIPPVVAEEVDSAVGYIESAGENLEQGRELDPVFNHGCTRAVGCAGQDLNENEYEKGMACFCEDYTQYVVRGHYTETEELKRYFRSYLYLARMSMRIKSPMETRMAALLSAAMNKTAIDFRGKETAAIHIWDRIYRTVTYFSSVPDDLTFIEYDKILREVYGEDFSIKDLADDTSLENVRNRLRQEREREISTGFAAAGLVAREQSLGLRIFGQRFDFDSYVLNALVSPQTGPNPGHPDYGYITDDLDPDCRPEGIELSDPAELEQCQSMNQQDWAMICCSAEQLANVEQHPELADACRRLPSALDIAAAFGSSRAREHLGETIDGYCGFRDQLDSLQQEVSIFGDLDWFGNLNLSWLFVLRPLFNQDFSGFPAWMTNDAYADRNLNTALSSWAEQRHDNILYVKQSYIKPPIGVALPPEEFYWLEPIPEVFAGLSDLAKLSRKGLSDLDMFAEELDEPFNRMVHLFDRLTVIAIKELEGKDLNSAERYALESLGQTMHDITNHLALVTGEKADKPPEDAFLEEHLEVQGDPYTTAVMADLFTDNSSATALQAGSGNIDWLVIVRRIDEQTLGASVGPIYSYYEFPRPVQERLDDEQWRDMIDDGRAPARPRFVGGFHARQE